MRFEIRAGGALAILIGLGFLSGAVFVLGLVAGYEMGRQQENTQEQMSTVYPLPSPAFSQESPSPSPGLAAAPGASPSPGAAMAGVSAGPVAASAPSPLIAPPPSVATPAPAIAETRPTPAAVAVRAPEVPSAGASASSGEHRVAGNPPAAHKPRGYNIQIQAVMDKNGADAMVAKLHRMGYQAYTMETQIGGQTWYRVRVGPYATEAEARAAEERLHQQYSNSSP